mmetsp:Transcript_23067/g.52972  ORF Transcript_23067/g.52972 Transcript_23067/m.52972 type:complete len:774 (+) Transcript_23067:75-2396(+)
MKWRSLAGWLITCWSLSVLRLTQSLTIAAKPKEHYGNDDPRIGSQRPLILSSIASSTQLSPGEEDDSDANDRDVVDIAGANPYSSYANRLIHNPYEGDRPFRFFGNPQETWTPPAPKDQLMPGIEAQGGSLLPPNYKNRAVYYPHWQDHPHAFATPEEKLAEPEKRSNHMKVGCGNSPVDWRDRYWKGCAYYAKRAWCTSHGTEGMGWNSAWGTLKDYAFQGVSANTACCACGGGRPRVEVAFGEQAKLADRRLVAAEDRVPDSQARWFEDNFPHIGGPPDRPMRPVQAPEDRVPIPVPLDAPADALPARFSRYLKEVRMRAVSSDVAGFSVRYYSQQPSVCSPAEASAIDRSLEYGISTEAMGKQLGWPIVGYGTQMPRVWWGKWTGTLTVFMLGDYYFDLDLAFPTDSTLKIDGVTVVTPGQCYAARTEEDCNQIGCRWSASATCLVPTVSAASASMQGSTPAIPPASMALFSQETQTIQPAPAPQPAPAVAATSGSPPAPSAPSPAPVLASQASPTFHAPSPGLAASPSMIFSLSPASSWAPAPAPGSWPSPAPAPVVASAASSAAASDTSIVTVSFVVEGIDYNLLVEDDTTYSEFQSITKDVIAKYSGHGITADDITVNCSSGSVVVDGDVHVPDGVDPTAVAAELDKNRVLIEQDLLSRFASMPGLDNVATGPISISGMSINGDGPVSATQLPGVTNALKLQPGAHCVEVLIKVPSSARTISLRYHGPDTNGKKIIIPGTVVYCDPVIPACKNPELQACPRYTPKCA